VAPLAISRASAKQTGKKHGKGTVKASNGFVSVADDSGREQLVPLFTNRKDLARRCLKPPALAGLLEGRSR
jgi:hypothetical protein